MPKTRRAEALGYVYKGRHPEGTRRPVQPAQAGFVMEAEGFSPAASAESNT